MLPTKMFGMGMSEILVILLVAALFLGPEKLPDAATKIAKGMRDLRKQTKELTDTIENDTELGGAIRDLKSALRGEDPRRPPVRKPPPSKADTVAAAAAAVEAAERANLAAAAPPPEALAAAAQPTEALPAAAQPTEALPAAASVAAQAVPAVAEAVPAVPAPAAEAATRPAVTLPATAGDPDRDAGDAGAQPAAADDDDDEHAQLARMVRPASGAIKRDGHGPN